MAFYKTYLAPAKINFYLRVFKKREDGYHEIESFVYPIFAVADKITFSTGQKGIHLKCTDNTLPLDENNLVYKAAVKFFRAAAIDPSIEIVLEKEIPIGAGLGGGSSDAAVTLRALNELYGGPLSQSAIFLIATEIGADVPFFLDPSPAIVRGKGEKIEKLQINQIFHDKCVVLVYPGFGVSTAWAYKALNLSPGEELDGPPSLAFEIRDKKLIDWSCLINDLEQVVFKKFPILELYVEFFKSKGALCARMSGSGSTIFALFDKVIDVGSVVRTFQEQFGNNCWLRIVHLSKLV